jgi:hypothetical protein
MHSIEPCSGLLVLQRSGESQVVEIVRSPSIDPSCAAAIWSGARNIVPTIEAAQMAPPKEIGSLAAQPLAAKIAGEPRLKWDDAAGP